MLYSRTMLCSCGSECSKGNGNLVDVLPCGCRDFEKESVQARRQSGPALEMVRVADSTVEAAEQQVQAAREVAANAEEQLKAANNALT